MSYTLARLRIPAAVHELIAAKLRAAGYDHVFHGGTIDMTHIGLEVDADERPARPDAATGELIEVARAITAMVSGLPRRPDPHGYLTPIGLAILADVERLLGRGGSCENPATVMIMPSNAANYEDYTHSCDRHIAELMGYRVDSTPPDHYQVRPLGADEVVGPPALRCCYAGEAVPVVLVADGAPAIGSAP